jgi:hypothetical protein
LHFLALFTQVQKCVSDAHVFCRYNQRFHSLFLEFTARLSDIYAIFCQARSVNHVFVIVCLEVTFCNVQVRQVELEQHLSPVNWWRRKWMNFERRFVPDSHKILKTLRFMDDNRIIEVTTQALSGIHPVHARFQETDPLQAQQGSSSSSANPGVSSNIELREVVIGQTTNDSAAGIGQAQLFRQPHIAIGCSPPKRSASLPAHVRFQANIPLAVVIPEPPPRSRSRSRLKVCDESTRINAAIDYCELNELELQRKCSTESSAQAKEFACCSPANPVELMTAEPMLAVESLYSLDLAPFNQAAAHSSSSTLGTTPSDPGHRISIQGSILNTAQLEAPSKPVITEAQLNIVRKLRRNLPTSPLHAGRNIIHGTSDTSLDGAMNADCVINVSELSPFSLSKEIGSSGSQIVSDDIKQEGKRVAARVAQGCGAIGPKSQSRSDVRRHQRSLIVVEHLDLPPIPPWHEIEESESAQVMQAKQREQGDATYHHKSCADAEHFDPPPPWDEEEDSKLAKAMRAKLREKRDVARAAQGQSLMGGTGAAADGSGSQLRHKVSVDAEHLDAPRTLHEERDLKLKDKAMRAKLREKRDVARAAQGQSLMGGIGAASKSRFAQA